MLSRDVLRSWRPEFGSNRFFCYFHEHGPKIGPDREEGFCIFLSPNVLNLNRIWAYLFAILHVVRKVSWIFDIYIGPYHIFVGVFVKLSKNKTKQENKTTKQTSKQKISNNGKLKTMGNITLIMATIPGMDGWEIPILNVICHLNLGND